MHPLTTLIETQRSQIHSRPSSRGTAPRRRSATEEAATVSSRPHRRSPLVAVFVLVALLTAVMALATVGLF